MNEKTIKQQIIIAMAERNVKLIDVYNKLKEEYGKTYTFQNLSSKINRNTLKYSEVQEIANILQYDIKWIDNKDTTK